MQIEKLDDFGRGITYVDNKITFVNNTIPLDDVDIKIIKSKKNYNEAKVVKYLKYSPLRVESKCKYSNICGGCCLHNLEYTYSLNYKKNKVINYFKKYNIEPIVIKNNTPYNYRNKITLQINNKEIGYYKYNTNEVITIDKCIIAKESINNVIKYLKNSISNGNITLRSNYNDEILIIINTKDEVSLDIDKLKQNNKLVGIILNDKCIYNDNFFYEKIDNKLFKVSFNSFFQVNLNVASILFKIVKDLVNDNSRVLELYCGVGVFSILISDKVNHSLGVEVVDNAIINALFNKKLNKVNNVDFILNDASIAISRIDYLFDTLIVDPPRSGLSIKVRDFILEKLPKYIIYVSCDFHTLKRDIDYLNNKYIIDKFYILDMFSYTYHVECICYLVLK